MDKGELLFSRYVCMLPFLAFSDELNISLETTDSFFFLPILGNIVITMKELLYELLVDYSEIPLSVQTPYVWTLEL